MEIKKRLVAMGKFEFKEWRIENCESWEFEIANRKL